MTRSLPFIALALLVGCSSGDDSAGYERKSGDLGAFILQQSPKFGAHIHHTNGLPLLSADWRYKEDTDGFQIYIVGDHFAEIQSFLAAAFGLPAKPPTTNESAGTKHIGTYYGAELGAALTYGWESTRDGREFTSIVLVRQKR